MSPRATRRRGRRDASRTATAHTTPPRAATDQDRVLERATDRITQAAVLVIAVKLTLVVLLIDSLGNEAFAIPKAAASRALAYVLLALTAVQLIRERDHRIPASLLWSAGAYVTAVVAATAFAVHPYTSAFGAPRRLMGLTQVLDGVALALASAIFVRTRRELRFVLRVVFAGAMVAFAYAVIQVAGRDPISYVDRVIGSTVGNPGATGGYALIVAAMAGAMAFSDLPASTWERRLVASVGFLMVVLVILTGARGPVLAIALLAVVVAVIGARTWSGHLARRPGEGAAVVTAATALLALALVSTPTGSRIAALVTGGDLSTSERALIYGATLDAVARRPVLGVGMDGLVVVYPSVRPAQIASVSGLDVTQTSTHSWFLQQLLGAGILGLAAALAVVVVAFAIVVPGVRARSPLAIVGAAGLTAFIAQGAFNVVHIVTDTFFWLSIGLIAAAAAGVRHAIPQRAATVQGRATLAPAIAAVLAGVVASVTVWNVVDANRATRASNRARLAGDLVAAERLASRATQLDPGRADHWNVLGLARAGRPEAAAQAFLRATEAAPYEPVYLLNLAREEARASARDPRLAEAARQHAASAADLDPNNARTHLARSKILAVVGELGSALAAAERAVELYPSADNYDWASLVSQDLGRYEDAIDRLRAAHRIAYPDGVLPLAERLRLANLYWRSGDSQTARSLVRPPSAIVADASCTPTHGRIEVRASIVRPRCIRVVFNVEAPLLADPMAPGAVTRSENYLVGGEPLPAGSTVAYDEGRFAIVQLPASAVPPAPHDVITVRGITDVYGNLIRPDPAVVGVE